MKSVELHTNNFLKSLENVEIGLSKNIQYLTQVSTGMLYLCVGKIENSTIVILKSSFIVDQFLDSKIGSLKVLLQNHFNFRTTSRGIQLWLRRKTCKWPFIDLNMSEVDWWYVKWKQNLVLYHTCRQVTGSFTKPLAHGFVESYFFQSITVHDTEVLKNLIG